MKKNLKEIIPTNFPQSMDSLVYLSINHSFCSLDSSNFNDLYSKRILQFVKHTMLYDVC